MWQPHLPGAYIAGEDRPSSDVVAADGSGGYQGGYNRTGSYLATSDSLEIPAGCQRPVVVS